MPIRGHIFVLRGETRLRDCAHSRNDGTRGNARFELWVSSTGLATWTTIGRCAQATLEIIRYDEMTATQSNGFDVTARQLIVGLPLFMGVI